MFPALALSGEQAFAQNRLEHRLTQGAHAVIIPIFNKAVANNCRVSDLIKLIPHKTGMHDGVAKGALGKGGKRIFGRVVNYA